MTSEAKAFETGPYLAMACFCERVLDEKDNVKSIIRVVDRFTVTATGADAPSEMPPVDYVLRPVIMLKSGSARGAVEVKIEPEGPDGIKRQATITTAFMEGEDRGANIVGEIHIRWTAPGLWWFNVYLGGTLATRMPFRVIYQRVVPGAGPGLSG